METTAVRRALKSVVFVWVTCVLGEGQAGHILSRAPVVAASAVSRAGVGRGGGRSLGIFLGT